MKQGRRFAALVDLVCGRPLWVVATAIALAAWSLLFAASHLSIDSNREGMIDPRLDFRRDFASYQKAFPQFRDNLLLVIDAATPEGARTAALQVAARLRDQPDLFRHVRVPRAEPFLERNALLYLSADELEQLTDRLAAIQPFLGRLARDRSLRGLFSMLDSALEARESGTKVELDRVLTRVSDALAAVLAKRSYRVSWQELMRDRPLEPDDRRQLVLVQPQRDYGSLLPATRALARLDELRRELHLESGPTRLAITGGLALAHEEMLAVMSGAEWIGLLVAVLVGSVLVIGLRSWRLVCASLFTLVVGLAWTAGFAAIAIGHLNLISIIFAALYLGLGVDYAIHYCLKTQELIDEGSVVRAALVGAAADIGGSLALCALTTAFGFYAFVPTAYAGISELGIISGTSMFLSLIATLTVLPAVLALLRPRRRTRVRRRQRHLQGLLDLPVTRPRSVLAVALLVGVATLPLLSRVYFDPDPLNLRDPQSESVRTFRELLRTSKTPPWSVAMLATDEPAGRTLVRELQEDTAIGKVIWLNSFVPKDQDAKLELLADLALMMGPDLGAGAQEAPPTLANELAAARTLGDRLQRVAADPAVSRLSGLLSRFLASASPDSVRRLETALLATLPENLARLREGLATEGVRREDLPKSLRTSWIGIHGSYRVEAFPAERLGEDLPPLRRFVTAVHRIAPHATGTPVHMVESARVIVGAFQQAMLFAMLAALIVLLAALRRVRATLLVFAPLVLASLVTAAALVLAHSPFNFANVIALPLLLGVGVDSAIHIVLRAQSSGPVNPLHTSSARGVLFSTLTTICSFGALALSPHRGTASMGVLLTLGIIAVLACTLIVLPALLAVTPRTRS